ncbi:DeoR/GlpR family DNA-binding transcription regulator [Evansella tamaricis]|uniref:DeoR/GlpR family DNA-binding transcription regulator n=1 Tax=Evansella tamaricis TaxID=2069301 RepID=A0ABS6JD86_9BACI|nr:DeoR/GlpR family DNA-binding transcription regulator [Evansella tamaricis]MBU9711629.1 DeoR/GlpR family DNA-binding transcription regulator [Evansella tamaricis]
MLSVERYEEILHQIEKKNIVKVSDLSKILGVTEKTIRLDLETLEQRGLLTRIHGGAMLAEKDTRIFPIEERQSLKSDEKRLIANEAVKHIKPGETILMDGGSTTLALASLFGEIPVTVITNDIRIASVLLDKEKVQLIVLGGSRIGTSSSLFGSEASELLKRIRVNRLFFGTTGVSIQHGLTVLDSIHADWKRQIIKCADHVTLLADSSKFEKVALIQFAPLDDIDDIITNSSLQKKIKEQLEENDISVILADR